MGKNSMKNQGPQIIIYKTDDGQTKLQVKIENETVWLTQDQMSELFDKGHFAGAWEVPATTSKPTTLGGLIEKPVLTCSWCERWYRATREPPPRDAVEAHRDGRRVKLPGATPNGTPFADYLAAAKGAA